MKSKNVAPFGTLLKRTRKTGLKLLKQKTKLVTGLILILLYCFGVFTLVFEISYKSGFHHPLDKNITKYVEQLRRREIPDLLPINMYNYKFISASQHKCRGQKPRVVYVVKSARENFENRLAIRRSWGFEKRFSDVAIRTVFLIGISADGQLEKQIEEEQEKYNDLIQANYVDTYYNNTIKTMIGFKWAMVYCKSAQYYFFSDDDMYVSTKNLLRFLKKPEEYPGYLEVPVAALQKGEARPAWDEMPSEDVELYAGHVFLSSHPMRHVFSKWYVSLSEYPYDQYPPYIAAGAYVLSREALIHMFYASAYTSHFRFDDVFLGIVARKINLSLLHNENFHFYKKPYNVYEYRYVIASHGYESSQELLNVWNEQKSAGNA